MPNTVIAERNLFVNTSTVLQGNGRDTRINLPQGYADCRSDQQMKMSLSSFTMEKKFYNINDTNRLFFMTALDPVNNILASNTCEIAQGNYRAFGGRQLIDVGTALISQGHFYDKRGLGYALKKTIEYNLGFEWVLTQYQPSGLSVQETFLEGTPVVKAGEVVPLEDLVVVEFNSLLQTYTITINLNSASFTNLKPNSNVFNGAYLQFDFFTFELPSYRRIPNTLIDKIIQGNLGYTFVDTHELLGGCSVDNNESTTAYVQSQLSDANPVIPKFFIPIGTDGQPKIRDFNTPGDYNVTQIFETKFQASLRTTEAVYVRTDLPADNFQTASFDTGANLFPFVIKSDILAKIPLPNPIQTYIIESRKSSVDSSTVAEANYDFQLGWEYITFQDNGDIFGAMLNTTHLSQLRIYLTDDKGRLLPYQSPEQAKCNEMYFTATLKITVTQID